MKKKPKKPKQQFGEKGEALAAAYLENKGYTIITTNWHCPAGELDIIANQNGTLVFVEVRSRHSHTTETALESIDKHKRAKIRTAALMYLVDTNCEELPWRIDVIAIAVPRSGQPILEHVEDAFDW